MQRRELPYGLILFGLAIFLMVAVVLDKPWIGFSFPFLVILIALVEKPILLFYAGCLTIPFSVETQLTSSLGTDIPDEPFMWLNTASVGFLIYHQRKKLGPWISHPIVVFILLSWLWSWVSLLTAADPILSLKFILAKTWYLVPFLIGTILLLDSRAKLGTAICCIVIPMVFLSLVTMLRQAGSDFSFEDVSKASFPYFRNHVNYGALLACSIPPVYYFYKRSGNQAWLFALFLQCVALYFSYSRGAWLALIVALFIAFIMKRKLMNGLIFFSTASVLFVSVWLLQNNRYLHYRTDYRNTIYHSALKDHMEATYTLKDLSGAERIYRWIAGWRMAKEHLTTGVGPNHFYPHYKSYTVPSFRTYVSENAEHSTVHNYFLLLLSEQGIPGLLLFLFSLISMFATAQKIYTRSKDEQSRNIVLGVASVLGMITVLISLSDLIETDKIGPIFYICAGVLVAASSGSYIERIPESVSEEIKR